MGGCVGPYDLYTTINDDSQYSFWCFISSKMQYIYIYTNHSHEHMKINISKRFEELIARGGELYKNSYKRWEMQGTYSTKELSDNIFSDCVAWKLSSKNLLQKVYGEDSEPYTIFNKIYSQYAESNRSQYDKENISQSLGVLKSAKEEFDLGFTHKIMHILSVEFFDNILDQSKELLKKGYKDPAAILGRVIIENTLKDLSRRNNIQLNEGEGASSLNEKLKSLNVFTLPQFKLCRTYIEIGNDAAHGNFDKYSQDDIKKMFEYIETSLLVM